jgi:hypothetical protein
MTLRGSLLSFRIQQFETVVIVGAAILSVAVSGIVIALFNAGGYAHCYASDNPVFTSACQSSVAEWLGRIARLSVTIVPIFPVLAGLLAGGPIVARELESGTARLAWSLGPSRIRWFLQRAVPILVMATLACLAIGLTAESLHRLLDPVTDFDRSFVGFRARGPLLAAEGLLIAGIALAFGALLGRIVPTIICALVLVLAITIAIDKVERTILLGEAQVSAEDGTGTYDYRNSLFLESRLRFPDGETLTYEQAVLSHPEIEMGWSEESGIRNVVLFVPGERYHDVERREIVALGTLGLAFVALGTVIVLRRRPR